MTYEITCTKGGKKAGLVKSFLSYTSSTAGQAVLPTAGYVKLPDNIVSKVAGRRRRHLLNRARAIGGRRAHPAGRLLASARRITIDQP